MTVAWWDEEVLDRGRFGAVVEDVLRRARRAADAGRLPHALLLVGLEGMGRELAAAELAAMLTCPEGDGPWCSCRSCERARRGRHPDVERVGFDPDWAKKLGRTKDIIYVEQIREEVVARAAGRPYEGVARVWILDRVERQLWLPSEPANAFLKTLEEPPPTVHFILLAANPGSVLPTVRSRCQTLRLPGAVALAEPEGELPELTAAGEEGLTLAREVRAALEEAAGGDPLPLVVVSRTLPSEPWVYQAAAAAALELAAAGSGPDGGEACARLARRLLEAEREARTLNIREGRLLLSRLMEWYRDAVEGAA